MPSIQRAGALGSADAAPVSAGTGRTGLHPSRAAIAAAALCLAVALGLCLAAALGGVSAPAAGVAGGALCLVAFAAALLVRERRGQRSLAGWRLARPAVVALAVPLGFYLMERPSNDALLSMDPYYVAVNLCVLAVLFALVYALGQRSRAAVAVFLAACFLAGVANHFVIAFKGQPVVPADLFALSTAASVGSGYAYVVDGLLLECVVVFAGYCTLLAYVPKVQLSVRRAVANTAAAVVVAGCFGWWFASCNIEEAYACTVDVWGVKESYAQQGSALCFLKRAQDLSPARPDGYDVQAVEEILAGHAGMQPTAQAAAPADERPAVVAIMNETFSDLSRYPGLADTEARPAQYYDIAASALDTGEAYVSALGGGTCNSEFEFLTGSSMGHLGGGVYPYVLYDLDGTESLVSYFASQGYETHAIHPAENTNWRRDRVYAQLGFDEFTDISAFEGADTLRDLTTDRATYDYVLDLLEEDAGPKFVFDVTIQNHGGYDTGGIDDGLSVAVPLADGSQSSELDEYASCIRQADRDLAYLVERLDALDRPVVLCFFGDHQPGFSDWLFEATHDGAAADEIGLEAVQERYTVPYMIWANERALQNGAGMRPDGAEEAGMDAGLNGRTTTASAAVEGLGAAGGQDAANAPFPPGEEPTSLNYLGARLAAATGLPTTRYQNFLLATSRSIPAINLNGFLTADGAWHWFGEETDADDALRAYAIVQYDNLFNKDSNW